MPSHRHTNIAYNLFTFKIYIIITRHTLIVGSLLFIRTSWALFKTMKFLLRWSTRTSNSGAVVLLHNFLQNQFQYFSEQWWKISLKISSKHSIECSHNCKKKLNRLYFHSITFLFCFICVPSLH